MERGLFGCASQASCLPSRAGPPGPMVVRGALDACSLCYMRMRTHKTPRLLLDFQGFGLSLQPLRHDAGQAAFLPSRAQALGATSTPRAGWGPRREGRRAGAEAPSARGGSQHSWRGSGQERGVWESGLQAPWLPVCMCVGGASESLGLRGWALSAATRPPSRGGPLAAVTRWDDQPGTGPRGLLVYTTVSRGRWRSGYSSPAS